MGLITPLLLQLFQMALMLALAPLLAGGVRVLKARLQRRAGPPVLQIYRDLAKLIGKDTIVATDASWMFRAAPYLIFAATWVSASLVPSFGTNLLFSWSGDLIVIVALLGTARFFQMLAALDIGTAFGGLGASREAMFASLAEPAMLMIVFTVALVAGSSQLSVIATFMHGGTQGLRLSLAMGLVALVIVSLAETGRFPVDNPATHLELTMVHEAMVLEYSGRHLALIELAHALKLTLYLSLIACIFAPIAIAAAQPELVLGTQMERHIAKRLGIPCAVVSAPTHVQDFPARHSPFAGFEGANVLFDTLTHPLMMGLEEHLLGMFREDFEFNDQAAPSHLGVEAAVSRSGIEATASRSGIEAAAPVPAAPGGNDAALPQVGWEPSAEAELRKIPFFVRGKARRNTELFAAEHGVTLITIETIYDAKAHFSR